MIAASDSVRIPSGRATDALQIGFVDRPMAPAIKSGSPQLGWDDREKKCGAAPDDGVQKTTMTENSGRG